MYFEEVNRSKQKTHTGFRLTWETLEQLEVLVRKYEKLFEENNMKANRTSVLEYLIHEALTEQERWEIRERFRQK